MAFPFAISLGRRWHPKTGRESEPVEYAGERHLILFGPNGSGKGVTLEIPNLLRLKGLSIISIDPKGQNAAVTARWRRTVSDVVILNPLNVQNLGSAGFNPVAALDPDSPKFFEQASAVAEALIKIEGKDPFFDTSARGLMLGLIMWEVKVARAASPPRAPLLDNVRKMLTGDLPAIAKRMVDSGDAVIASLMARYVDDNRTNQGIRASADSQSQWLLSQPMLDDLAKDGIDFAKLKGPKPITLYVILPAHALETFSVWLRLVITCAFNALYRQETGGGLRTLFMLSEFAQLGQLKPIMAALGQARGYGVQLWPVLQDINQLRTIYGKDAANTFLGMSGATFAFTPNESETAEFMSLRSGDVIVPGLSVSDDPQAGARDTRRPERQRAIPPDAMYNIPEFHGLVWFAGESAATPVYAAPYWTIPELKGRYDPDPYHPGSSPSRRRLRQVAGVALAGAALAALVAGFLLLAGPRMPSAQAPLPSGGGPVIGRGLLPAPPAVPPLRARPRPTDRK